MSIETDQSDDGDNAEQERDLDRLKRATTLLMEHFETVQIFVTRHVDEDAGTIAVQWGGGNWYARRGQIGNWVKRQDGLAAEGE